MRALITLEVLRTFPFFPDTNHESQKAQVESST